MREDLSLLRPLGKAAPWQAEVQGRPDRGQSHIFPLLAWMVAFHRRALLELLQRLVNHQLGDLFFSHSENLAQYKVVMLTDFGTGPDCGGRRA
jgi:hypothetical protein